MYTLLVVLYVLVCTFLVIVVLLQPGRGGMGGAFGAGVSQQVFGGAGPTNILQKITAVCAALFMVLSVALAYMSSSHSSDLDEAIESAQGASGSMGSMRSGSMTGATPETASPASTEMN